jgi:phage-related protein
LVFDNELEVSSFLKHHERVRLNHWHKPSTRQIQSKESRYECSTESLLMKQTIIV